MYPVFAHCGLVQAAGSLGGVDRAINFRCRFITISGSLSMTPGSWSARVLSDSLCLVICAYSMFPLSSPGPWAVLPSFSASVPCTFAPAPALTDGHDAWGPRMPSRIIARQDENQHPCPFPQTPARVNATRQTRVNEQGASGGCVPAVVGGRRRAGKARGCLMRVVNQLVRLARMLA